MAIKKEARVIGIDDAPFDRKTKKVLVIGVVYRGGLWMEGVVTTKIRRDGDDGTEKLSSMINSSRFYNQLKAIFLGGITIAGFNVIDIKKLNENTGIPVIAVARKFPDYKKIFSSLEMLGKKKEKEIIEKTKPPKRIGNIFVQWSGCSEERVKELLKITCLHSRIPEPLRAAHLIGAGIILGESKGNP